MGNSSNGSKAPSIVFALFFLVVIALGATGSTFLGQNIQAASTGWHLASLIPGGAFGYTWYKSLKEKEITGLQYGVLFVSLILFVCFLAGFTFNFA